MENCSKNTTYLCLCMRALKARPSLQQVVKFWMLTSEYLEHGETFCNFKCKPMGTKALTLIPSWYRNDLEIHCCSWKFLVFFIHCSPCGLHLAPEQQGILGRASFSVVFRLYFDHLDLKKNTARQQFSVWRNIVARTRYNSNQCTALLLYVYIP